MGFLFMGRNSIWQGIDFGNEQTKNKAGTMIKEMIMRDKNRCALIFWGSCQ